MTPCKNNSPLEGESANNVSEWGVNTCHSTPHVSCFAMLAGYSSPSGGELGVVA